MNLGAVLVVGTDLVGTNSVAKISPDKSDALPRMRFNPIACVDILGRSIFHRTVLSLKRAGVHAISVIADPRIANRLDASSVGAELSRIGNYAEAQDAIRAKISAHADNGTGNVLLMEVDAYIDFDFADLAEQYKDRGALVARLNDRQGPLNAWIVDGVRARNSGLSVSALLKPTFSPKPYRIRGYVNRLSCARDLRKLAADAFAGRCAIRPAGVEVKPHVWIHEGASVHRLARIVAPAYIGRNTRVRRGALITRGSNIEQGCVVERGTVVEDTSVLANTYLGQGLDVSHAVVDGARFVHLKRNVTFEVADSRLLGALLPAVSRDTYWVDPILTFPRDSRQVGQQPELPAQIA